MNSYKMIAIDYSNIETLLIIGFKGNNYDIVFLPSVNNLGLLILPVRTGLFDVVCET